tara:strand:+ start:910 stop:1206 length:297 start_codon:yes stop_codon:yes gene_type:complete
MSLNKFLKKKKLLLLNIILSIYIITSLISGERGLISFYEKSKLEKQLKFKVNELKTELSELEKKNMLLSTNLNLDFIDTIYREKLKFGKADEVIIKLK